MTRHPTSTTTTTSSSCSSGGGGTSVRLCKSNKKKLSLSSGELKTTRKRRGGEEEEEERTPAASPLGAARCHHHYCQRKRQEQERQKEAKEEEEEEEEEERGLRKKKRERTAASPGAKRRHMADMARRNDLRSFALVAQEAQRWADAMRTLARETQALEHDEQHLLALAYRNLLQPTRNAWHTISSLLPSPSSSSSSTSACATIGGKQASIRRYRDKLEAEVQGVCEEVIALLRPLLRAAPKQDATTLIFLNMMAGDYNRYLAEVSNGGERATAEQEASSAYAAGSALAKRALAGGAPLRLSLALNHAVLCHHHLGQPAQAIAIAQAAVAVADVGLAELSQEHREESEVKRSLLVANIREWQAEERSRREQQEAELAAISARRPLASGPCSLATADDESSNKENESWRSLGFDGIDLLPPSLADLVELGE